MGHQHGGSGIRQDLALAPDAKSRWPDPPGPSLLLLGLVPGVGARQDSSVTVLFDAATPPPVLGAAGQNWVEAAARSAVANVAAERGIAAFAQDAQVQAGPIVGRVEDVLAVADLARHGSGGPTLFKQDNEIHQFAASNEARARLGEALASGYWTLAFSAVAAPDQVPMSAWWLIDLSAGRVWDEFETGRHQPASDRAILEEKNVSVLERFRQFSCKIRTPVAIATLVFRSGNPSGKNIASMINKIYREAAEYERKGKKVAKAACGPPGIGPPKP